MIKALFAALALLVSSPAWALNPATEQFLNELGIAPDSPEVRAVAKDIINGKSLDTLAAKRDEMSVRRFITTRNFFIAYKKNSKTPFPEDDLYEPVFLSKTEVTYIANKLSEPFNRKA